MLVNYKKAIFLLKRAFLGEIQRPVRRVPSQISSLRGETHFFFFFFFFLTFVQLTFMLHYRIYGFSLTKLSVWKAGASKLQF